MYSIIALVILATLAAAALNIYRRYMLAWKKAKQTGFVCIPSPIIALDFGLIAIFELLTPLCRKVPYLKDARWIDTYDRNDSWIRPRVSTDKHGDTFLIVSLVGTFLRTANAELIGQLAQRRTDFLKPVKEYGVVDIFGRSIISQEGSEFKRHRRIVAPSFSEKSNKLVFEETLRQVDGMIGMWSRQGKNTVNEITIEDVAHDTATFSLHIICAAGFGVRQIWPGESEANLEGTVVPGFNTTDLSEGHTLPFKESLVFVMGHILWILALPSWVLKWSPLRLHNKIHRAYIETGRYFNELLDLKKKQMYMGESDKGTMDLMGPMIKASAEAPSDFDNKAESGGTLSKSEIIGNSFVFLFAGHETTANSIHYSFIMLATNLASQILLQSDIDNIIGDKPTSKLSYHTDMPRLYNSMVGAVMNEELRLMPVILNIPKIANGDQVVTQDGRSFPIASGTNIQLNIADTHRNPRYWPCSPSKRTKKSNDLDDFVPERWLTSNTLVENATASDEDDNTSAGKASYESGSLFTPIKNSFIPFSEGARACPGRRFAQVSITAALTAIFQGYSVELDVSEWATDEQVAEMGVAEKKLLYQKASDQAEATVKRCGQWTITLQMRPGDHVPLRFVKRGKERFLGIVD